MKTRVFITLALLAVLAVLSSLLVRENEANGARPAAKSTAPAPGASPESVPASPVTATSESGNAIEDARGATRLTGAAALPADQRTSLETALSEARRQITPLTAEESAMPHNRGALLFANSPHGRVSARFLADSARIAAAEWPQWPATLSIAGYPALAPPAADGTRVELRRTGGITEWYDNGPEGLEHGLTLREPLGAAGADTKLRVAVGGLRARTAAAGILLASPGGDAVLAYQKLKVTDADGRELPSSMEASADGSEILITAATSGARFPVTVDPLIISAAGVFGPDISGFGVGSPGEEFGSAVALSGNTAVIGAWRDTTPAAPLSGTAYVFVTADGTTWTLQAKLSARLPGGQSDAVGFSGFGFAVSLDGEVLVVGAPYAAAGAVTNAGAAYVFRRTGTAWNAEAKLTAALAGGAADASAFDNFGDAVAVAGDWVVAGAYSDDNAAGTDAGAAYVYERAGGAWTARGRLASSDLAAGDQFGKSVAIHNTTLVVGSPSDDTPTADAGSAYVFTRPASTWTQQTKLEARLPGGALDAGAADLFGVSVAVDGDTAAVGAFLDDNSAGGNAGAVYVYTRAGATWSSQARLLPETGANGDTFGRWVGLSGNILAVADPGDDTPIGIDAGSLYAFSRSGTTWSLDIRLDARLPGGAPDGVVNDRFGTAVDIDGARILCGRSSGTRGQSTTGFGYLYSKSGSVWSPVHRFDPGNGGEIAAMGASVAVSGDTAAVGVPAEHTAAAAYAGSVYLFSRQAGTWARQGKLNGSNASISDNFGHSVSLDGNLLVAGAPGADNLLNSGRWGNEGAAYIFSRSGLTWTQNARMENGGGPFLGTGDAGTWSYPVGTSADSTSKSVRLQAIRTAAEMGGAKIIRTISLNVSGVDTTARRDFTVRMKHIGKSDFLGSLVWEAGGTMTTVFRNTVTPPAFGWWTLTLTTPFSYDGTQNLFIDISYNNTGAASAVGFTVDSNTGTITRACSGGTTSGDPLSWNGATPFAPGSQTHTPDMWFNIDENAAFGQSVAVSGGTVAVGAPGGAFGFNANSPGSASVFSTSGALQTKLTPQSGGPRHGFGATLAASGDTLLVGAPDTEAVAPGPGSVEVFTGSGASWSRQTVLTSGLGTADGFGISAAIDGDLVLVGAPRVTAGGVTNKGKAFAFSRNRIGNVWSGATELIPSSSWGISLGQAVAIDGFHALIGAPGPEAGVRNGGVTFVMKREGGVWTTQTRLEAVTSVGDAFGAAAALDGDTALIGALGADGVDPATGFPLVGQGRAYFFRIHTPWTAWHTHVAGTPLTGAPANGVPRVRIPAGLGIAVLSAGGSAAAVSDGGSRYLASKEITGNWLCAIFTDTDDDGVLDAGETILDYELVRFAPWTVAPSHTVPLFQQVSFGAAPAGVNPPVFCREVLRYNGLAARYEPATGLDTSLTWTADASGRILSIAPFRPVAGIVTPWRGTGLQGIEWFVENRETQAQYSAGSAPLVFARGGAASPGDGVIIPAEIQAEVVYAENSDGSPMSNGVSGWTIENGQLRTGVPGWLVLRLDPTPPIDQNNLRTGDETYVAVEARDHLDASLQDPVVATTVGSEITRPAGVSFGKVYSGSNYADEITAGLPKAYSRDGDQRQIIPVNTGRLEIWWHTEWSIPQTGGLKLQIPSRVAVCDPQWAPSGNIVIASQQGTGSINPATYKGWGIYARNAEGPGFNPNDEHAMIAPVNGTPPVTEHLLALAGSGPLWVAAGAAGTVLTSTDGVGWTRRAVIVSFTDRDGIVSSGPLLSTLCAVAWSGDQWLAAGHDGVIITSPDGITWTLRTSGTENRLKSAAWTGTQWIVAGAAGTILTSPDGVAWTARLSPSSADLNGVAAAGGLVAVCGAGGVIITSLDGITWSSRASGTAADLNAIAAGGGTWLAAGAAGAVTTSVDGLTWTAEAAAGSAAHLAAAHDGSSWVITGQGGRIYARTPGMSWVEQPSGVTSDLAATAFVSGLWLAAGHYGSFSSGATATSWGPPGQGSQAIYALRDDLGRAGTSQPFVLMHYREPADTDANPRYRFRSWRVVAEEAPHFLHYSGDAGRLLQAPYPLSLIKPPGPHTDTARIGDGVSGNWFRDRTGNLWAKGAGDSGGPADIEVDWWYTCQSGFYFPPGSPVYPVGTSVPWFDGSGAAPGNPKNVTYTVAWPASVPELRFGETLVKAKYGLPQISGQDSVQIIYEQGLRPGNSGQDHVTLIDYRRPVRVRIDVPPYSLAGIPNDVASAQEGPVVRFGRLPPYLASRLSYDPVTRELKFTGRLEEPALGQPYVLPNVITARERSLLLDPVFRGGNAQFLAALTALCDAAASDRPGREIPAGDYVVDPATRVSFDSMALTAGKAGAAGYVTLAMNNDPDLSGPATPVSLEIIRVAGRLYRGTLRPLDPPSLFDEQLTMLFDGDLGGYSGNCRFQWKILPASSMTNPSAESSLPGGADSLPWLDYASSPASGDGAVDVNIGGPGLNTLVDNYFCCRWKTLDPAHPLYDSDPADGWSQWTLPGLAEGWIKRVTTKLTPFNQRFTDLSDPTRTVDTTVTMISLAGPKWEGNVPFTQAGAAGAGLIEAYETVLNRGIGFSIEALPPVNNPGANNALLLAAGKLTDMYMLLANEAYADAADPTIALSVPGGYTASASRIHCFMNGPGGASLLEEELGLLRGRDDSLAPGVRVAPVYNRLIWNFTADAGQVAYVNNYNITDAVPGGGIGTDDAKKLFPQGHGDAWGHALSAVKVYYRLLRNPMFTWQRRSEQLNVGGVPVEVDYMDERKFARAAALRAQTGAEIVSLTARTDYREDPNIQWRGRTDTAVTANGGHERAWGTDDWASRAGEGAWLDWVAGNALLPASDTARNGIQKIDRTTVTELRDLAGTLTRIQAEADKADAGLNPLGLLKNTLPLAEVSATDVDNGVTLFEKSWQRAVTVLNNAIAVFNRADHASQGLRAQFDSLTEFQQAVAEKEMDYRNRLIEIYGYPYSNDIGGSGSYPLGYVGPDVFHYMYHDPSDIAGADASGTATQSFTISFKDYGMHRDAAADMVDASGVPSQADINVTFHLSTQGLGLVKPAAWTGARQAAGRLQITHSDLLQARVRLLRAIGEYDSLIAQIEDRTELLAAQRALNADQIRIDNLTFGTQEKLNEAIRRSRRLQNNFRTLGRLATVISNAVAEVLPQSVIVGLSSGGDFTSAGRSAIRLAGTAIDQAMSVAADNESMAELSHQQAKERVAGLANLQLSTLRAEFSLLQDVRQLEGLIRQEAGARFEVFSVNEAMIQAAERYKSTLAEGQRLLEERLVFRQKTAANVQQMRYKDMAFRIFRDDALEKYRAQFDLAASYVYLAARAYDYETNWPVTGAVPNGVRPGREFLEAVVRARAIGEVSGGVPMPGQNSGDGGLADPLRRMKDNWETLRPLLGYNQPQNETMRFSLRRELFRIPAGSRDDKLWRETLERFIVPNVLTLPEFKRFCIPPPGATLEPALVIPFSTSVHDGANFFGWPSVGGDNAYSVSVSATKIQKLGVWFSNYNNGALGLVNAPRVYLVPVGNDVMRSPVTGGLREWKILEQTLPVPFALSPAAVNSLPGGWIPSIDAQLGSEAETRRFSDFRAYHDSGGFSAAELTTSSRLIGRSVWNTRWLLIIRGRSLLSDPAEGIQRFINGALSGGNRDGQGIKDILLNFQTYAVQGF